MSIVFVGVIAFIAVLVAGTWGLFRLTNNRGLSLMISLAVAVAVAVALMASQMVRVLSPGEMGRAYNLVGGSRTLTMGYNFVMPWDRVYKWDMRSQSLTFTQGDAVDDAFGAQTQTGDYLTAIANITLRIDPDRLDAYVERFGNEDLAGNAKIALILKNEMKRAMENALMKYDTRTLMNNKAKAAGEARDLALEYMEALPFVVETLWFVDFEASAEYEKAIREQAELRMLTDKAALQESLNLQEAKNNRVKADGEAEVKRIAARAEADANQIRAENEATVAKIAADRDALVKKVQVEADANVTTTLAQADATARVAQDTAQAQGAEAIGKAYQQNPELLKLKQLELQAEWAKAWNGMMPQLQGMSSINFADMTEVIKGLLPGIAQPAAAGATE